VSRVVPGQLAEFYPSRPLLATVGRQLFAAGALIRGKW